MNQKIYLNVLIVILALLVQSCKTPERTAYDIVASTQVAVDAAMNGWGDYVRSGLSTSQDEMEVKSAYISYQNAMGAARSTVIAYKTGVAKDQSKLDIALNTLQAAGNAVIGIVTEIKSKP